MNRVVLLATLAAAVAARPAAAAIVFTLQDSGTTTAQAGEAATFVLAATNTGTEAIDLAGVQFGLQILPQGLATGTATITAVAPPAVQSPWIDPGTTGPTEETLVNGDVDGSSGYYLFSISENDLQFYSTIASGSTVSLASVTILTSPNTRGLWNLSVVNESSEGGIATSSFTDTAFNTSEFANLVAPAYPDAGTALKVQSIEYVPEPSALALVGAAAAMAALRRRRATARLAARGTGCGDPHLTCPP